MHYDECDNKLLKGLKKHAVNLRNILYFNFSLQEFILNYFYDISTVELSQSVPAANCCFLFVLFLLVMGGGGGGADTMHFFRSTNFFGPGFHAVLSFSGSIVVLFVYCFLSNPLRHYIRRMAPQGQGRGRVSKGEG